MTETIEITHPDADQGRLGLSALHIDTEERGHFFTEFFADRRAVEKFLELGERDGLLIADYRADDPSYAVLDVLDSTGDIITDRLVPDEAAWLALNSELRLRVHTVEGP